jgi:pilus assembly protein CpaB
MRKNRLLIVLLLAVASGAIAGYSILEYLRQRPTPLIASESSSSTVSVVIAARELPLGALIGEEDVQLVEWPGRTVPEGYATSLPEVVGRGLVDNVQLNEPILASKLAEGRAGLAPAIPSGMRAISVQSNEVLQVAGHVLPGTTVDVILIGESGGAKISKIIMQNLPVRGVAQDIQEDAEGNPRPVSVVTVIVSPEDAEKLKLATTEGQIHMALRNPLDIETIETRGERPSGLFTGTRPQGGVAVQSSRAPAPQVDNIVEIYRGGVRTLISY